MQPSIPVQIVFHGIGHSEAVQAQIRKSAAQLEELHPQLGRCHVSLELPHRHKQQGKRFAVRVALQVRGGDLLVSRSEHEDLSQAVHEGFRAARRQLEDRLDRQGHKRTGTSEALADLQE